MAQYCPLTKKYCTPRWESEGPRIWYETIFFSFHHNISRHYALCLLHIILHSCRLHLFGRLAIPSTSMKFHYSWMKVFHSFCLHEGLSVCVRFDVPLIDPSSGIPGEVSGILPLLFLLTTGCLCTSSSFLLRVQIPVIHTNSRLSVILLICSSC